MHRRELGVRGASVGDLPGVLHEESRAERKGSVDRYGGDGFDVIVVERYYLRNNSDRQATVVVDRLDEESARVAILSGGGGTGLLQISLGSHSTQTGKTRGPDRLDLRVGGTGSGRDGLTPRIPADATVNGSGLRRLARLLVGDFGGTSDYGRWFEGAEERDFQIRTPSPEPRRRALTGRAGPRRARR